MSFGGLGHSVEETLLGEGPRPGMQAASSNASTSSGFMRTSIVSLFLDHCRARSTSLSQSRKEWIQQSSIRPAGEDQQGKNLDNERHRNVDDIVETVKHDPYSEVHEQRLLGCIVDSGEQCRSYHALLFSTESGVQYQCPLHFRGSILSHIRLTLCGRSYRCHCCKEQRFNRVFRRSTV